jgi:hypothetical protein
MRNFQWRTPARLRFPLLVLVGLWGLLIGSSLEATPLMSPAERTRSEVQLPEALGEIVYQTKAAASQHIFIIANAHRSAITGANAGDSVQAQIETFRIGEWLIRQNRIDLLLPEGFFGQMGKADVAGERKRLLDRQTLQAALKDTSKFMNAELLLHNNYGIGLEQIEDRKLYRRARERLRASLESQPGIFQANRAELDYLQKLRTATILQSAPAVIESAYQQGRIAAPNAMLTIGLSHLDDIIAFLKAGEVSIAAMPADIRNFPALGADLEVHKKLVGVTVIVPPILVARR